MSGVMHDVLSEHVTSGKIPGLVALVSRGDHTHVDAIGVPRNAIFRIASLSRLITAVAAMILVEECKIRLNDSIEPWLPELANRRVLKSIGSALDDTVPAKRAITLRDLLTCRMGFGCVMAAPDTYPIQKSIRELKIGGDGPPRPALAPPMDEWLNNLGSLPWMAQPGERWLYHTSGDVLGALIARIAGTSLGAFLRERIFHPLGMNDTSFHVPTEKLDRFYPCYSSAGIFDGVQDSAWRSEPPFESGGGGLVSTVDDFYAFCQMMLKGGEGIVSPATIELMTQDHLTPDQRAGSEMFFGDFSSWGLGFAVDIAKREIFHTPGRYGWTGGTGTTAYIDPAKQIIGILFTLRMMDSPDPPRVFSDFFTVAYSS